MAESPAARSAPTSPAPPPSDEGPSPKAVANVRAALLQLLAASDADLLAALRSAVPVDGQVLRLVLEEADLRKALAAAVADVVPTAVLDADSAKNVMDLVRTTMRNDLRPDAFRKPRW